MKLLRALIRSVLLLVSTLVLIFPILGFYFLKGRGNATSFYFRQLWIKVSLRVLGVRVTVKGLQPSYAPSLFVGNHWSYFDPVATLHFIKADPVAKAEVKYWPIIGQGADATGVLFVKREDPESRKTIRNQLADNIKNGRSVLIYPEGTTTNKRNTLPFKKGTFIVAANHQLPVVPIAILYDDIHDAWIGDDTFLPHFLRSFGKKETHIQLFFGPVFRSDNPEILIEESRSWINQCLSISHAR